MINKEFIELAKQKVLEYHTENILEPYDDRITLDNVFVAWYSKVLQNHKALLGISDMDDQHYYEATYNGDKKQLYLDVYNKQENKCFETVATRGKGVHGDPIRNVDQYWSKDGKLLAEKDIIRDMEVTHGEIKKQK